MFPLLLPFSHPGILKVLLIAYNGNESKKLQSTKEINIVLEKSGARGTKNGQL